MSNKADNIFKFLKAFRNWESKNPLTPIQEKLLMRIMIRVNENHWKEWTPISNTDLISELRINKPTLIRNRDYLQNLGIIRYKKGSKGNRSIFGLNMPIAETTFVFPETKNNEDCVSPEIHKTIHENENNEDKVSPEIPKTLPKNENNEDKVFLEIPKTLPKTLPNNSETPHEQCVTEPPKRINDKRINDIYLTTFDIYKYSDSQNNLACECVISKTGERCKKKAEYCIDGKNYCNQHSKGILKKAKACTDSAYTTKDEIQSLINNYTENEELRLELNEYLKIRKAKKVPTTARAMQLGLNKLSKLSDNDEGKIAIVQRSIEHGWIGFFPLSDTKVGVNRDGKASYDIEGYQSFCRNNLMSPKSTDAFSETLDEQEKLEFIEVEVT